MPMTEQELREMWKEQDEVKGEHALSHAALVELTVCHNHGGPAPGTRFVVIEIGENLAENWPSGAIISFWDDGEHTALDGLEFEVLNPDLFVPGTEGAVEKKERTRFAWDECAFDGLGNLLLWRCGEWRKATCPFAPDAYCVDTCPLLEWKAGDTAVIMCTGKRLSPLSQKEAGQE